MKEKRLRLKDIRIGMRTSPEQLSHILDTYMIIAYENTGDTEGTLVFIGDKQNQEYDSWFMQDKPITPIHHTKMELEENVVYDE